MLQQLSTLEQRVIGVLLEKEETTPEQYPLSLNSVQTACNQKSNREPVMDLDEASVLDTLQSLMDKHLLSEAPLSGRVIRYQHRFCNTQFGDLQLSRQQKAILCVLFLRGPQTPGELRTRCARLGEFSNVSEVESCLQSLSNYEGGALVLRLERQAGKRDARYCHCFMDTDNLLLNTPVSFKETDSRAKDDDLNALKLEVAALREELDALKLQLQDLL